MTKVRSSLVRIAPQITAARMVRDYVEQYYVPAAQSRRKTVVDAALDLAEELVTARIEFVRSVVRSAGEAMSK